MEKVRMEELYAMVDYIVANNSYLKGKLKDKEIGTEYDSKVFEDEISNVKSDVVKKMIKSKMDGLEDLKGRELMKRYGKLFLKDSVYNKVMGIEKKKNEVI